MRVFGKTWVAVAATAVCAAMVVAQGTAQQEGATITVTVTAVGRDQSPPPPVPQNEVVVRQEGKVRPVVSWLPAKGGGAGLDLIVLVDDALSSDVANRWDDLRQFLRSLPVDSREAVAYASFGAARFEVPLTKEHEAVAKGLRIPMSPLGASNGIYDSVRDVIRRWPSTDNRKVLLLISSGLDFTNGISNTHPSLNYVLQRAIDQAQRSGVSVYTLYASGEGRLLRSSYLVMNGQGSLSRLAAETGGDSFFLGSSTPVSFQPFLEDIRRLLGQQYLLTFVAGPEAKAGFKRLEVIVETHQVEILAPDRVYVPGPK
jgi:hypothetical protein